MRRPSGARAGGSMLRAGSVLAECVSICSRIRSDVSPSSTVSESRNGAIDFVIAVHNTRSSAESTRRRLPSLELIESVTLFGRLSWHATSRARTRGRSDDQLRAWRRKWNIHRRCNHIATNRNTLRHEHHKLPTLFDTSRNVTDLFAMPEIDIGASRSDNCRSCVLRHQQMTEFGLGLFSLDRKLGINPDWRSIN